MRKPPHVMVGAHHNEGKRLAAVAKAEAWTRKQADWLNTRPTVILEAVRHGGLPADIEGVESKYALEGIPPPLDSSPSLPAH